MFLGAGTLGTTEILLRSRSHGLSTSPLLGKRLSGNGDLLAFAYNCDRNVNCIGRETAPSSLSEPCGPTITGCVDLRQRLETSNVKDAYVVQEGAVPEALGPVIQAMLETHKWKKLSIRTPSVAQTIARVKSWMLGPYCESGSVNRTAAYLVMSHDDNEGSLEIKDNEPVLRWSGIGAKQRSHEVHRLLAQGTASIGGTLIEAPSITVHPLGGACMSNDNTGGGGVVNHVGQLYQGSGGGVYDGIICVDASVIPTSLGKWSLCPEPRQARS